jgi:hypothetical protein
MVRLQAMNANVGFATVNHGQPASVTSLAADQRSSYDARMSSLIERHSVEKPGEK